VHERRTSAQTTVKSSLEVPKSNFGSGRGSIKEKKNTDQGGTLSSLPPSVSTLTTKFSSVGKNDSLRGTISEPAVGRKKGHKEIVVSIDKRPVNAYIPVEWEVKLEGVLAAEVSLVILDVHETILSVQNPKSYSSPQSLKMFNLLCRFFDFPQSEAVLLQLFGTIKAFIFKVLSQPIFLKKYHFGLDISTFPSHLVTNIKFTKAIFKEGTAFCSDLCQIILRFLELAKQKQTSKQANKQTISNNSRYCASPLTTVREYASALIYLLMKKNAETSKQGNFMKVFILLFFTSFSCSFVSKLCNKSYCSLGYKRPLPCPNSTLKLIST